MYSFVDSQEYEFENQLVAKCFKVVFLPPMNDVVVQILSGLDMDEISETASMELQAMNKQMT
jgi:hypothetical protein